MYEKAVSRRSNSLFNPKTTLAKLREGSPPEVLDQTQRKALIDQYLDVSQNFSSLQFKFLNFLKNFFFFKQPWLISLFCLFVLVQANDAEV